VTFSVKTAGFAMNFKEQTATALIVCLISLIG